MQKEACSQFGRPQEQSELVHAHRACVAHWQCNTLGRWRQRAPFGGQPPRLL